jgi:tripartite-type tricarboxylate transporter receptor subunit TctC
MKLRRAWIAALALGCAWTGMALAADYPNRTITLVVPYAPGGSSDFTARVLAKTMTEQLHQPVVVDNRAGGSGVIGAQYVSSARPDGYTLLYAGPALAIAPFINLDIRFDAVNDITPVTLVTSSPYLVLVNASLPIKSIKDLVDYAKAHADTFKWGSSGFGSTDSVGVALFDKAAGINPPIIQYKGGGPQLVAAVSGEVDAVLEPASAAKPYMDSGQLRALAVTSKDKVDTLPDLPTVASEGYPDYELSVWYGVWGSKGLPKELADAIYKDISTAVADPGLKDAMTKSGVGLKPSSSPEDFGNFFKSEYQQFGSVVKDLQNTNPVK